MDSIHDKLAAIAKLPPEDQTAYRPFMLGNDTPLDNTDIHKNKMNRHFVLVGTALFRTIDIACHLLTTANPTLPTIIIIDNSRNNSVVWKELKECFASAPITQKPDDFLFADDGFLEMCLGWMDQDLIQSDGNIAAFFMNFFKKFPFSLVQQIVANVHVIEQSWTETAVFTQIRSIFPNSPIVAYHSNIIDFVQIPDQISILRNLEILNPCLSLCTNLDKKEKSPTQSFILTNNNPLVLCEALALDNEVKCCFDGSCQIESMQVDNPTDMLDSSASDSVHNKFSS